MLPFLPTIILRHRKENLKKCSLKGLENRKDMVFLTYPTKFFPDLSKYIVLTLDAPQISKNDADKGLFLIDATWRYAEVMHEQLPYKKELIYRSIPSHIQTAYPRKQTACKDPKRGLASIEALSIAYFILGRKTEGLLDDYFWKEKFLSMNAQFLIRSGVIVN